MTEFPSFFGLYNIPWFVCYPFIHPWTLGLFLLFGCCEQCSCEHSSIPFFRDGLNDAKVKEPRSSRVSTPSWLSDIQQFPSLLEPCPSHLPCGNDSSSHGVVKRIGWECGHNPPQSKTSVPLTLILSFNRMWGAFPPDVYSYLSTWLVRALEMAHSDASSEGCSVCSVCESSNLKRSW